MPLYPFATPEQLQILMPVSDDLADLAVRLTSSAIRSAVGWDVDFAAGRTYSRLFQSYPAGPLGGLDPALAPYDRWTSRRPRPSVVLPALNVTNVTSVVADGRTLTSSEWDATTGGVIYLTSWPSHLVTVTYDAGWVRRPEDMVPGAFTEVCIEHACSLASNPEGLRNYSLVGASENFNERTALVEDGRLDSYRVNIG